MIDISKVNFDNLNAEPYEKAAELSKIMACEGSVLLKNEKDILPIKEHEKISVFGRGQFDYIKSGSGSGGLVNVKQITNITDSLKKYVKIDEELEKAYRDWILDNPFEIGDGWSIFPMTQKEMPLSDDFVKASSEKTDKAIIVLGKSAGEGLDNKAEKGSYYINDEEYTMIKTVRKYFDKVCVLLNVGNVIDMQWVYELDIPSVMYIWQNGMEGGRAAADVICGKSYPSGKLTDTIIKDKTEFENLYNFGSEKANVYQEDIYVGYRFYETFCPQKVQYSFGYGIGYTQFDVKCVGFKCENNQIIIDVCVTNIGNFPGKEVVQVYFKAPVGTLGRPERELIRFKKTKELNIGECENIVLKFDISEMKTYADSGEYKYSYILEFGEYNIYVGTSIRDVSLVGSYNQNQTQIIEKVGQALAPVTPFNRIKHDGKGRLVYEPAPMREYDIVERIHQNRPAELEITGDKKIRIQDVRDGINTLDEFISQFDAEDLACISRGQGMNSPRVTPGTGCAYGGVSDKLNDWGIPPLCGTDGPSGLRMDSGAQATSIPNGTCIASSWNPELAEDLYTAIGIEMRAYKIETLLGPGMNIHRTPLNGRNFEYFSEDPYLSGIMAIATSNGIDKCGVSATIKHFVCNEQEKARASVDSIVSERALREIYLKPFEMAVKNTNVRYVMTAYNLVNGIPAGSNYDLNTTILRNEWGYKGLVMTDWWATLEDESGERGKENTASMVRAQNDIYMVTPEPAEHEDNIISRLKEDWITIGELQRNVKNICRTIICSPNLDVIPEYKSVTKNTEQIYDITNIVSGENREIILPPAQYMLKLHYKINDTVLAQHKIKFIFGGQAVSLTLNGTDGQEKICEQAFIVISNSEIFRSEFFELIEITKLEIYK